jgi:DNA-binding HxlR family transcriptional regulator
MEKIRRSPCPIACALDVLGDKWTMLVIRDLFCGKTLFKEFLDSPEKIATNILSSRLSKLQEAGMVERFALSPQSSREAYRLTETGNSLGPLLKEMAKWGLSHCEGTQMLMKPQGLSQ